MKKLLLRATVFSAALLILASSAYAEEYTVKMVTDAAKGTYYFEPKQLTIKSGDTVTWVNAQDDTHEVMSESVPEGAQPFESPSLDKKDQKWSHTFTQSGTYEYHCHPHEALKMTGVIIVDKPSEAQATPPQGTTLTAEQATEYLKAGKPVYSCPMHEHVLSDKEGRCPICGMNLVQIKEIKDGHVVFDNGKQSMPMDMNDKDMQKVMETK